MFHVIGLLLLSIHWRSARSGILESYLTRPEDNLAHFFYEKELPEKARYNVSLLSFECDPSPDTVRAARPYTGSYPCSVRSLPGGSPHYPLGREALWTAEPARTPWREPNSVPLPTVKFPAAACLFTD